MKKSIVTVMVTVMVLALMFAMTGCGNRPETAIDNFFAAAKNFDSDGMSKALDPTDKGDLGSANKYFEETEDPAVAPFIDYLKENAKKMTYEVTGIKTDGKKATVTVKCKYIDGTEPFGATIVGLFKKAVSSALAGKEMTNNEMIQLGAKLLKENTKAATKSYTEKTIDVPCIQVDGTWYVKEFNDDLVDVVSSNLYSVAKELKEK